MSFAVVVLQILACLGAGAFVLRALGLFSAFPVRERPWWAFAIGLGVFGWLIFPLALAGLVGKGSLLALEVALAAGCALFKPDPRQITWSKPEPMGWTGWSLVFVALVVIGFDLAEALAPPLDADSLAYHYARARDIVRDGRIVFAPLAVDGAGAFLAQMTYVPPLALGGERALTLWCMASGWAAPMFLYAVARRWTAPAWAAAAALVLATTPAWLYGAGSGQVETRLALFAFAGALAAAEARKTGSLRLMALAGLMAGFFAGGKFLGLLFVAAVGLVLVFRRSSWRLVICFSAAALCAGFQWYLWNFIESGDPVFPGLFRLLGTRDATFWNPDIDAFFRATIRASEQQATPVGLWVFLYPFAASAGLGFPSWEAGRTGLGPFVLLAIPFVLGGLWTFRNRLAESLMADMALVSAVFYALWFLIGPSQRIRHLLPLWPAVLLCVLVAANHWAARIGQVRILAGAVGITLTIQIAGHALFTLPYLRHIFSGEERSSFLARRAIGYPVVSWVNAHLDSSDRLLTMERPLNYFLEKPYLYFMPNRLATPDFRDSARDIRRQWIDLRQLGITHVLLLPGLGEPSPGSSVWRLGQELVQRDCAQIAVSLTVRQFRSRTLPTLGTHTVPADILKLRPDRCDPEQLPRE